jgi:PAP2 superfamily
MARSSQTVDGAIVKMILNNSGVKWASMIVVGFAGWTWASVAGLQLGVEFLRFSGCISVLILIALIYNYTNRDRRIMELAHFGAQYLFLLMLLDLLTALAVSTNAPLVDHQLESIDKAMGFDWVAWKELVFAHPFLRYGLRIAYGSLPLQLFCCYIYNARVSWRNSEIWWITFMSGLITMAGCAAFPAINPYVYYGLERADHFIHMQEFLQLRAGTMHVLGKMSDEGLVQLPSFHTVLAIMVTYNLRHNRWLLSIAVALNCLLIVSCPTEGSHYLIDLIAGAAVAAATIWGVRLLERQPATRWVNASEYLLTAAE